MKSKFLLMSALASMFLIGCSSDEPAPNGGNEGDSESRFITVNLVSSDETGGRALAGYEDGTNVENQVTKVRFYFFTANGDLAQVKKTTGGYINYHDWNPGENQPGDKNEDDDIEKKLGATIVINTTQGDKIPQQIVAILNPDPEVLDDSPLKLSQLIDKVNDYSKADVTEEGKFVMSNSVYPINNKGKIIDAVTIKAENLCKTEEDAKKNPVKIHVERCCAKVRVNFADGLFTDGRILLKDKKDGTPIDVDGNKVYLKITDWSLTAETSEGRLLKEIDLGWNSSWWYKDGAYRCFWARNSKTAKNRYYDYNAINNALASAKYTNENAAKVFGTGLAANHTKVILKGSLQKENGDPFTIVRHLGVLYADTPNDDPAKNLPILANSILAQLAASNVYLYYGVYNDDGEETSRVQIGPDDIEIVPVEQIESEPSVGEAGRNCYVYAQLTEDAKKKTWYYGTTAQGAKDADALDDAANFINDKLQDPAVVDRALVWNNGMTYYYYEIIHNKTTDETTYGVVRNHIYDTTVGSIAGLGTPVYDPDEVIYPEKPKTNDHFIAAEINILSWRVVTNSYDLEW